MSAEPYTEDDVQTLADVITDASLQGINAGHRSLARFILDRYAYESLCGVPHLTDVRCSTCVKVRKQ